MPSAEVSAGAGTFGTAHAEGGREILKVESRLRTRGVQAMRMTWKDAAATVAAGGIVAVYAVFLNGTSAWLLSSARGTVLAVLVLGVVGCGFGTVTDLYLRDRPAGTRIYTVTASVIGVVALAAAVTGLITANTVALATLVAAALALWLLATARHALGRPAGPALGRDEHEVIHPAGTPRL